jgi:WD40-like Beta Propeller Repeat
MAHSSRSRTIVVAVSGLMLLALLVVSCGPSRPEFGLNAISPDGQWATLLENPDKALTLASLNLETGTVRELSQAAYRRPESSFSPEGRYVVFRVSDGWTLVDTSSLVTVTVGTSDESVQFLPDGELLIVAPDPEAHEAALFSAYPSTNSPPKRTLLAEGVKYLIRSNGPGLVLPECGSLASSCGVSIQSAAIRVSGARFAADGQAATLDVEEQVRNYFGFAEPRQDLMSWILVGRDGSASLLKAGRGGWLHEPLLSGPAEMLVQALARQEKLFRDLANLQRSYFESQLRVQAEENGQTLSRDELAPLVDAAVESAFWDRLRQSLLGVVAPDGSRLLMARISPSEPPTISVDLVVLDFEKPSVVSLASDLTWLPFLGFSPDGKEILFESVEEGARGLYVANSDGTNKHRLPVDVGEGVEWLRWN